MCVIRVGAGSFLQGNALERLITVTLGFAAVVLSLARRFGLKDTCLWLRKHGTPGSR